MGLPNCTRVRACSVHTEAVADHLPVPADAVRGELERILASKGFQTAGRLSRLLRHVTEKTLAGETDQLKEYAVGVEVFDRGESFDPRIDSIVRVEAGRLRTRLDEYYAGDGSASDVRIALPKGGYIAQFQTSTPAQTGPAEPAAVGPSRQSAASPWGRLHASR